MVWAETYRRKNTEVGRTSRAIKGQPKETANSFVPPVATEDILMPGVDEKMIAKKLGILKVEDLFQMNSRQWKDTLANPELPTEVLKELSLYLKDRPFHTRVAVSTEDVAKYVESLLGLRRELENKTEEYSGSKSLDPDEFAVRAQKSGRKSSNVNARNLPLKLDLKRPSSLGMKRKLKAVQSNKAIRDEWQRAEDEKSLEKASLEKGRGLAAKWESEDFVEKMEVVRREAVRKAQEGERISKELSRRNKVDRGVEFASRREVEEKKFNELADVGARMKVYLRQYENEYGAMIDNDLEVLKEQIHKAALLAYDTKNPYTKQIMSHAEKLAGINYLEGFLDQARERLKREQEQFEPKKKQAEKYTKGIFSRVRGLFHSKERQTAEAILAEEEPIIKLAKIVKMGEDSLKLSKVIVKPGTTEVERAR